MRTATLTLLLVSTAFAGDKKTGHPYLDDQGTLTWYTKLADAQAAAKRENKLILVAYGHEG
jgi:hypothetical protein